MSRNKPEDLFQLIKSLNQSEKGYFKKFASAHAGKEALYLRLFDATEKQKYYEEQIIRKQLGNITPELLKRTKHYLYNLILRGLDMYHTDSSADDTIRKLLKYAELLYNKGLHEQSYTTLKKAKALAYKYEKYLLLPAIFQLEIRIAFQLSDMKALRECIMECKKETGPALEKARRIIEHFNLNLELTSLQRTEGLNYMRGERLKQLQAIIKSPRLKDDERTSSYFSKISYYSLYSTYYLTMQKPGLALEYERKKLQLMESHPEQIEEFPYGYIAALNNLHSSLGRLKKYSEMELTAEKMKNIPEKLLEKNEINRVELFSFYYCNITDLYNKTGRFEKSVKLIGIIEEGLEKFKNKLRDERVLFLYFNMSVACFGTKQFRQSLYWLNKIMNHPEQGTMQMIYSMSRLLNLLIHYELKRDEYLEYLIRSTYRYLAKRNRLYKLESILLQFIGKKLPFIYSQEELIKAFRELKKDLHKIAKDSYEGMPLQELDLISWLESKIEGKPFAEIVRKKAGNYL